MATAPSRWMAIIGAAGFLGLAGWGLVEWRQAAHCQGLEEDFLNAFDSQKRSMMIANMGGSELKEAGKAMLEVADRQSKNAIEALVMECGSRAADTAIRKASETVF